MIIRQALGHEASTARSATVEDAVSVPQVIAVSARTAEALASASARLADALDGMPQPDLAAVACTLMLGRAALRQRRTVVAASAR